MKGKTSEKINHSEFCNRITGNRRSSSCRMWKQGKENRSCRFAAKSLNGVMDELCEKYNSEHPNVTFQTNYDSSGTLMTQIKEGAKCNIFFSAGVSQMDELQAGFDGGDIVEGSRRDLPEQSGMPCYMERQRY